MAEFCLNCWNRINETNDNEKEYIISKDLALCEGCGELKPVIIMKRKEFYIHIVRRLTFPIRAVCMVLYVIWRLLILPYLIIKYYKSKNKNNL